MLKRTTRLFWIICVFISSAAQVVAEDMPFGPEKQTLSVNIKSGEAVDWANQLKTGDILITESSDPMDFQVLLLYPKFSPFFHIGIVEVTSEGTYIYDANGSIKKTTISGAPSDFIGGQVNRSTLEEFITDSRTVSIFSSQPGVKTDQLIAFAQQKYSAKTPFDPYFNSTDHTKLYCTEFVALALEYAGGKRYQPVLMRRNASAQMLLDWMKVSSNTLVTADSLVHPGRWKGTVSLDYSLAGIVIDRSIKYELYRRFTANQKIGNILDFSSLRSVDFRSYIEQFRDRAYQVMDTPTLETMQARDIFNTVHALADDMLGAHPDSNGNNMPACAIDLSACAK